MKKLPKKLLTPRQEREIDIKFDWSNALCWNDAAYTRIPAKHRGHVFGGDADITLSEMAELTHKTGGRVEFLVVPAELDEWKIKRAIKALQDRIIANPKKYQVKPSKAKP